MAYHPEHDALSDLYLDMAALLGAFLPDVSPLAASTPPFPSISAASRALLALSDDLPLADSMLTRSAIQSRAFLIDEHLELALRGIADQINSLPELGGGGEQPAASLMLERVSHLTRAFLSATSSSEDNELDTWIERAYEMDNELQDHAISHAAAIFDSPAEAAEWASRPLG